MHYRAFERTKGRSFPNLLINKLIWPVDPVQVKLPRKNRTLDNGNYHEWLQVEKRILKQWRARRYANTNRLRPRSVGLHSYSPTNIDDAANPTLFTAHDGST